MFSEREKIQPIDVYILYFISSTYLYILVTDCYLLVSLSLFCLLQSWRCISSVFSLSRDFVFFTFSFPFLLYIWTYSMTMIIQSLNNTQLSRRKRSIIMTYVRLRFVVISIYKGQFEGRWIKENVYSFYSRLMMIKEMRCRNYLRLDYNTRFWKWRC
jgi:hypothetical protein